MERMPQTRMVILGGGFAGLRILYRLHNALYHHADITLVDSRDYTLQKPGMPDVALVGTPVDMFRHKLQPIADRAGARFIQATAQYIDPMKQTVALSNGQQLPYDYLFITTGIVKDYDAIEGYRHFGYSVCDDIEAPRLHAALQKFKGGPIVLGAAKTEWGHSVHVPHLDIACEGPMGEVTFMLDHDLRRLNKRQKSTITLFTPGHEFLEDVGTTVHHILRERLDTRGVTVYPRKNIKAITEHSVQFSDGTELPSALTIVIPPYTGPTLIKYSGLGDDKGYVPTDYAMRHLSYPNIFAAGDVNALTLPKLGHLAIIQADISAATVIRELTNTGEVPLYKPEVFCIMYEGGSEATLILSNTMYGGKTDIALHGVSAHLMKWSFDSYYFYSHGHLPPDLVQAGLESVLGHVNIKGRNS
ncbi:sulfide:quinone oxidoreductase [Sulfobacillus thermosulfidooxidans DSM 9293]|uniref:Sulfide:quinone oxidoreductase n=1 Tax=Sulfobacillus thermosulfidooxidans (strain DSM 9293 / VKM B-1269 / AT-1) TaxID=929705 RepID=A0A1W1W837_SULTA|nr:FAD-dependent oxidoreductase [Sulfobacillus thermosulfidooxidans]SMC02446.1 sulfide:quinone oxidoreductase [Sulfobacillus thermosulfidooxidans DSM 9293]